MKTRCLLTLIALTAVAVATATVILSKTTESSPGDTVSPIANRSNLPSKDALLNPRDNIVVIVIDTLRSDHLPFYGYKKDTAPFLNQLTNHSVIFDRAYAVASSTAPASASFLTSLLPAKHGVTLGKLVTRDLQKRNQALELNRIPEKVETMAEYLQAHGYQTFGVADNLNICPEMGFAQGFSKFRWFHNEGAARVNSTAIAWGLEKLNSPYFLYLHYMDPHQPYLKHAPWYADGGSERDNILNAYDSEISYVDEKIKELFERFGWRDNALVVVLSDHGEEFWEHGDQGHGLTLYREVIQVPYFFFHRGITTSRAPDPVSTLSLLPTIASLAGLPRRTQWQGEAVFSSNDWAGQKQKTASFQQLLRHPEHHRPPIESVVMNDEHLIASYSKKGGTNYELYNLASDPDEKQQRLDPGTPPPEPLRQQLDQLKSLSHSDLAEEVEVPADPETLKQLESLGYIGS